MTKNMRRLIDESVILGYISRAGKAVARWIIRQGRESGVARFFFGGE